jgi:hypothetical protein
MHSPPPSVEGKIFTSAPYIRLHGLVTKIIPLCFSLFNHYLQPQFAITITIVSALCMTHQ